jgi:hypothetical protein
MRRYGSGFQITPAGWLGLVWVYSGVVWLFAVWNAWTMGDVALLALAFLRMLITVAAGIAICAGERWGWGTGFALSLAYGGASGVLLSTATGALLLRPNDALSWQPILWGLTSWQCLQLAGFAAVLLAACVGCGLLLWRGRTGFEVPLGRTYSTVVRAGLVPGLVFILLDLGMLFRWWEP